ncbi:MAG: IS110 family transposase [Acidobacteria bacterium]|nr:IS110 family transposase [Acidobacteriota bacterium]
MNGWKAVVGVDVSKDEVSVAIWVEGRESEFVCKNNAIVFEKMISKVLKGVDKRETLIVMENTGNYHLKLACHLHKCGYRVSVVNPFIIKKYSEMKMKRAKTDKADAKIIASFGRTAEELKVFTPKRDVQYKIEIKLKTVEDFHKNINILGNQMNALKQSPVCDSELIKPYKKTIEEIKKQIKQLEKEINALVSEHYQEEIKILQSIPGVGKRLSAAIVSMLSSFESFEKGKQVASFLGICPSPFQSGTSVKKKGKISKKGNSYIRKLLFMCSLAASRFNEGCRLIYQRLKQKGKESYLAFIAVANKLIKICFACLKNRTYYSKNYFSYKET